MTHRHPAAPAAALAAALLLSLPADLSAHGRDDDRDRRGDDKDHAEIVVLSNRADLVSGGSALVEVVLPTRRGKPTVKASQVRVDSTARALQAPSPCAPTAASTAWWAACGTGATRSRPASPAAPTRASRSRTTRIGGPVFSGEQVQPWACGTETANANTNLGPALDAQCNAPTRVRYVYRTTTNQFAPYDPAAPAPANLATTTTDHGVTVPYIVRIERGTMNRGLHEIAVLFDPAKPWAPWATQPQWNRKVVMSYGAGTSQQYRQGSTESVQNHEALSLGYLVANSSMIINSQHSNFVTAAETTMMLKEHIVKAYGTIRYTIGQGSSGGALLQHLVADAYPGLLDGLRPTQDWEDSISGAYREFADSTLLLQAFNTSALTYSNAERGAIGGWGSANNLVYTIESGRMGDYNRPDDGTNCAGGRQLQPDHQSDRRPAAPSRTSWRASSAGAAPTAMPT